MFRFLQGIIAGRKRELVAALIILPILGFISYQRSLTFTNPEQLWRDTISGNPDSALANNNLGAELVDQKRYLEAKPFLQRAVQLDPDMAEAHNTLGTLYMATGNQRDAEAEFATAIQKNPGFGVPYFNLGNLRMLSGRADEAETLFQQAVRLNPSHVGARVALASVFGSSGRIAQAIEQYQAVLLIDADNVVGLNNLAWIYATDATHRNPTLAVALASRAAAITSGKDPAVMDTLIRARQAAGQ